MKIGTAIGVVLLVLNWGVVGYSPSVGVMMLFDSPIVKVVALGTAGVILLGLVLYVLE
ncbi:MAG: hypothetical protein ABIE25_01385 [Thermoplasmatota archaeon]|nr:hypothetical protein [Candidatus Thermoplasmatota archaeon]